LVNNELERMWKEAGFAYLDHYPEICLEGLRKTTKTSGTQQLLLGQILPLGFT